MNGAWAAGNVVGPALGGWLAESPATRCPTCCSRSSACSRWRRRCRGRRATPSRGRGRAARRAAGSARRTTRRAGSRLGLHSLVLPLEDPRVGVEPVRRCAEELEHLRVRPLRLAQELLAREDQELLPREDREPALELLRVPASRLVGVAPPLAAEVARDRSAGAPPRLEPLVLGGDRVLERERLAAERDLVLVVRERAVDRVADERDRAAPRGRAPDPLRARAGGRGSSGSPRRRARRGRAAGSGSCPGTSLGPRA